MNSRFPPPFRLALLLWLIPAARLAAEALTVDAMSTEASWSLTGQRVNYVLGRSALSASPQPSRPGQPAVLKLTYDLERRSWVGLQWRGKPLPGIPENLRLWVHGDGSGHHFSARFEDAAARVFSISLGKLDWTGWRSLEIPVQPASWTPQRRQGEREAPARFPVTLRELRVAKAHDRQMLGELAFSDLRAQCRIAPLDRIQVHLQGDAPAQVYYLGEPVKLQAEWRNSGEQPLEGDVEAVAVDWLGGETRHAFGRLRLEPGKSESARYAIPLERLGAYDIWVRFRQGESVAEAHLPIAVSSPLPAGAAHPAASSPFGMGLYLARLRDNQLDLAIRLAREAGIAWTREPLSMAHLQPEPGRWAWEPIQWTSGREGSAVRLGSGQPITVANSPSLNRPCASGELTLRLRLRVDGLDGPDRWKVLLSKGDSHLRQYYLYWDVPARRIGISFGDGVHGWSDVLAAKADWQTGQWYDVVVSHHRAEQTVKWWVDGAPAGEGRTRSAATLQANGEPLEIGRGALCSLDDLAIYDRSSRPAELAALTPVAWWSFDEGSGTECTDRSGNGNQASGKPPLHEQILARTEAQGIRTYHVLMGGPSWMASRPGEGIERPWNIMPRPDAWAAAVETLAARARSQGVRTWEIWNEPNIEPFWSPQPDAGEYCQILEASYRAIKKADPEATVLGCALAGPHGPQQRPPYEFVEEVLKRGGGSFMDAISIHPYRQPRTPEESEYVEDLHAISDLTARYGRRLPLWITEVGWPNDAAGSSEDQSARLLARSYLLALAQGVKNVAWYDYRDDGVDASYNEHHFGILTHGLTPKPAYFAFRTLATELAGMEFEREVDLGAETSLLVFRAGNRRAAAGWSHRGAEQVALIVSGRTTMQTVELMGNTEPQPCPEGVLLATLDESPRIFRDVPASVSALRPLEASPARLKLAAGQAGTLSLTLRNPFSRPATFTGSGRSVRVSAGGQTTIGLPVTAEEARDWKPAVWKLDTGQWLTIPAQVIPIEGQRDPIATWPERLSQAREMADRRAAHASSEVTIAFRIRAQGPSGNWIVPVAKWGERRNWGVYLTQETGELCFSATFERGTGEFTDFNSQHSIFDNRWHEVAVTYSAPDAELRFHVDGKLVRRLSVDLGKLLPNEEPVRLAQGCIDTRVTPPKVSAEVEAVTVWNRALHAEELGIRP